METDEDPGCVQPDVALLAEFRGWLDRERGLSPVSVRCYSKQSKAFLAGTGGAGAVSGLDAGKGDRVHGGVDAGPQAALFLAARGNPVTLAIRGPEAAAGMSRYLLDRLHAHPGVTVRTNVEVTAVAGGATLEAITVTDTVSPGSAEQLCLGLFCFLGADPATSWLQGLSLDDEGYVRTDVQLDPDALGLTWRALDRAPFPFETSVPAVFAAGDVRRGSVKRVAAAMSEGASAVRSVHSAIGMRL